MISSNDEDFQWPGSITISKLIGCLKSTYMFTAEIPNSGWLHPTSYQWFFGQTKWINQNISSNFCIRMRICCFFSSNFGLVLYCSIASLVISQVWPVASCSTKPGPWDDLLDRLRLFIVRRWGDLRFASGQATASRQVSVHGCLEDRYAHIHIIYHVCIYMCVCVSM